MMLADIALVYAAAYLIGSVPFGLILTKAAGMGDVRQIGSGNIGATNVLRTGHKPLALLTLCCDMFKGACAVWIARKSGLMVEDWYGAGIAAMLGHIFPIWLKFRGGKGVATLFGVLAVISLPLVAMTAVVWLSVFALTRYSSIASLTALTLTPIYAALAGITDHANASFLLSIMVALVIIRHYKNILRLLAGTEHKFGNKPTTYL